MMTNAEIRKMALDSMKAELGTGPLAVRNDPRGIDLERAAQWAMIAEALRPDVVKTTPLSHGFGGPR